MVKQSPEQGLFFDECLFSLPAIGDVMDHTGNFDGIVSPICFDFGN